jgi:hypothetical protein
LLDLCRLRFDFDIRQCLRRRAVSINIPPHESSSVGVFASRCWNGCANHLGGSRSHSLSGLNSRIAQAVRRIVMTATRNLKARRRILGRISDCGRYPALSRTLWGTGASRRPETPSQPLDAGQPGIANRTRAGLPRQ